MKHKILLAALYLFFLSANLWASLDAGIMVRCGDFEIVCRYHEGEAYKSKTPALLLDFFRAENLTWTLIRWAHFNYQTLQASGKSFQCFFSLDDRIISIYDKSGTTEKKYLYNLDFYSEEAFFNILNNDLGLHTKTPGESGTIRLEMVYSESFLRDQYKSDIFIGPLPGGMVTSNYGYTLFFWEKEQARQYVQSLEGVDYKYQVIQLTREIIGSYME